MPNWPSWFDPTLENTEPGAAFQRGALQRYGLPNLSGSIAGRYIGEQQPAYSNAFQFANLLRPPQADQAQGAFQNFVNFNSPMDVNRSAAQSFSQLAGMPTTGNEFDIRQQYAQPTAARASDLRNLAIQALLSRISPLALQGLSLPSGADLRDRFINETGGQPNGDFIGFVRNQLGLGMI